MSYKSALNTDKRTKCLPQATEARRYYSLTEKPVVIRTVVRSPSQYTFGELKN